MRELCPLTFTIHSLRLLKKGGGGEGGEVAGWAS